MKIKNKRMFAFAVTVLFFTIALANEFNGGVSFQWAPTSGGSAPLIVADAPPSPPTAINCSVNPASITLDNNVTVFGAISPIVSGVTVTLTYTKPDGSSLTRTVTSGDNGSYNDTYTPSIAGSWSVKASWSGNINFLGATSSSAAFTVTTPGAFSIEYVYAAVAIIVILVAVLAVYWYKKRK